jgi:hypothetical protein
LAAAAVVGDEGMMVQGFAGPVMVTAVRLEWPLTAVGGPGC